MVAGPRPAPCVRDDPVAQSARRSRRSIPRYFDVVIVDEFHHAEAPSYAALLEHLKPAELLGLTATPERMDGGDVTRWFGGRIAVELRVWEAIDRGYLAPFQYFGVADTVDLSIVTLAPRRVRHRRTRQPRHRQRDSSAACRGGCRALARLAADDAGARLLRLRRPREFMAAQFSKHGFESVAISGDTPEPSARRRCSACVPDSSAASSASTCSARVSTSRTSTRSSSCVPPNRRPCSPSRSAAACASARTRPG